MAGIYEVDGPHVGLAGVLPMQMPGMLLQRPFPRHRHGEDQRVQRWVIASRCSVRSIRTSTLRPCPTASHTSAAMACVLAWSLARCRKTSRMPASVGKSIRACRVCGMTARSCGDPAGVAAPCGGSARTA